MNARNGSEGRFWKKVAAITGAASGMGRALAVELAGRGCEVAICDVNEADLAETERLARAAHGPGARVTAAKVDVASRAAVYAWADQVVRDHGRVNFIFNNAGVALASSLEAVSYEDFEWIMGINFWGVVYGTKAFLPHLRASGDGHVVNTSSIFGIIAVPGSGTYNATKFAVRGFTEALRQELELVKAPVSATVVLPGGIKTNIARQSRTNDSMRDLLGKDPAQAVAEFERLFITSADSAARQILRAVEKNARRALIGPDAKAIDALARLLPTTYQRIVLRSAVR